MITFVGAGPGAVDLITVRGLRLIQEADVVIYAGSLVNPELLKEVKENCRVYDSSGMTLPEIVDVMVEAEEQKLRVVRLHTGDPSLFGAIHEQLDALRQRGIHASLCPGVSAMGGAAASLGEEYTAPGVTQTVIISRAEGRTAMPEAESLHNLAVHGASMVLFLSAGRAELVQRELLAGGYAPETPVAVVYKATWPDERILRTRLDQLAEDMDNAGIRKTALIIISRALQGGAPYELSRLYSPDFETSYRKVRKEQ
jgi:precorrin-4/cobalt-precorrin-4 C11-methyltransferase